MDDSSSDIETYLPDLSVFRLDEVAATGNRTLRRVARHLAMEATRAGAPLSGFSSSAAPFGETGTPESRILPAALQSAEESAEFQQPPAGFQSSLTPTF
ncbi:hypothetical protein [Frankia sp. EAN1pec]|uniref:hypothetical protein n=1 Tax=Parafrankia sp. (strain EAN1pec) TaxID=298653 RepID=UPI0000540EB8